MSLSRLSNKRYLIDVYFHGDVEQKPGVYIFYQTINGPERYVGRSAGRLYKRIRGRGYRYYKFKHCRTINMAYRWECKYWHKYQDTIDNSYAKGGNHPARPSGTDICCPICEE